MSSGWRKQLVFWVILVTGTLGVMELMVRIALPPPGLYGSPAEADNQLAMPHPVRGYALRPHAFVSEELAGRTIEYRINERGLRDAPMSGVSSAPLRLLAVGDSFTMGLRVAAGESWPEQLEASLAGAGAAASVVNAGVPGYSALQMRQMAEDLLPELKPRVLLFGFYAVSFWRVEAPYTLYDGQLVTSSRLWRVRSTDEGLVLASAAVPKRLQGLDFWLKRHFHLGAYVLDLGAQAARRLLRPPAVGGGEQERLASALAELDATRRLAQASGSAFVVVIVSKQEKDGSFSDRERRIAANVEAYCRENGISVVNPMDELVAFSAGEPSLRFEDDLHWNAEAHRLAARLVRRHLESERLLDAEARPLQDALESTQGAAQPTAEPERSDDPAELVPGLRGEVRGREQRDSGQALQR